MWTRNRRLRRHLNMVSPRAKQMALKSYMLCVVRKMAVDGYKKLNVTCMRKNGSVWLPILKVANGL